MAQILLIALIGGIIAVYLRSINQELCLLSVICTGILILFSAFKYLSETFELFKKISELGKIDNELIKLVIKIVAIGYIVEFAAGILEDFGLKSISNKLIFAGKIIILSVSVPIFYTLINVLVGLVTWKRN